MDEIKFNYYPPIYLFRYFKNIIVKWYYSKILLNVYVKNYVVAFV